VEKKRENGSTKAKRRLLKQLGWNVINISWVEYQMSEESVRVKLSEAGVQC
jgi:RAP domain